MRTRRHRLTPVLLVLALALAASACGAGDDAADDADDPAPAATTEEPDTGDDAADDQGADDDADEVAPDAPDEVEEDGTEDASTTATGTATVGGTEYAIGDLRRCEPLEDDMIEVELELQGFGESADGERVQIDVYVQTIGGTPLDDVSWAGPEGIFGNNSTDGADVTFTGDQVSGTATMVDALSQTEELDITFDLPVPAELIACR